MDEDDFLSELGITTNRKPSPVNNGNGGSKNLTTPNAQAAKPVAIASQRQANNLYMDTDVSKKKKKQPVRQQSEHQDDLQSWLASSPRDGAPSGISSIPSSSQKRKDVPLALEEDDTEFVPCEASERFENYSLAFEYDESETSATLKEELPFLKIAKSKIKKEDIAVRFVASWKQHCGGNLSDARMTNRCGSFLSALVLYHDPKLWAFLAAKDFEYIRPSLYEFYAPTSGSFSPIFELWDASILSGLTGFETPTQGSIVYAVGLLISNREQIMSCSGDVGALIDELRESGNIVRAIIVGSRAAKLTSEYFLRLVGEPELDWEEYDHVLAGEDKRSPASPPVTTLQKQLSAPLQRQDSNKSEKGESGAAAAPTSAMAWMRSLTTQSSTLTTASLKEGFSSLTQKMSEALQGAIDEDEDNPRPRQQVLRKRASSVESRYLYMIEYAGVRRLGLQLSQSQNNGLTVMGFDHSKPGQNGEAEEEGTVQIGDAVHSVNWVSVSCLPASIAGKVLAKQERPLHITFSTMHPQGRKLPRGLSAEAKAVQYSLLRSRLVSFYSRFGQSKMDDINSILRIFAKHEKSLVRGLYSKYGEPVPGDSSFASELVLVNAHEALSGGLSRPENDDPDPDDLVFVDVRDKEDRADSGIIHSTFCLNFDDKDAKVLSAISKSIKMKQHRTKICLLSSGKHRMFSLVDPARAAEEKGNDTKRLIMAARKLSEAGMSCICAIRGGFAECFREAALRQIPFAEGVLSKGEKGYFYKACDAYSQVDLKDTESLGRFILAYFTEFKEVIMAEQLIQGAVASGASVLPAGPNTVMPKTQDFQAAFSNLVPATMPSLSAMPGMFRQASGQGLTAKADVTKPTEAKSTATTGATAPMSLNEENSGIFSIDDE